MKDDHLSDPELSRLLRVWRLECDPVPGFTAAVWRRIGNRSVRGSAPAWQRILEIAAAALRQPRLAGAWIALLLLAGAGVGALRGQARAESLQAEMQGRYVRSIDPFAAMAEIARH